MEQQVNRGKGFLGKIVHMLHYFLAGKQELGVLFICFLRLSSWMPDTGKWEIKCVLLFLFLVCVFFPNFFQQSLYLFLISTKLGKGRKHMCPCKSGC